MRNTLVHGPQIEITAFGDLAASHLRDLFFLDRPADFGLLTRTLSSGGCSGKLFNENERKLRETKGRKKGGRCVFIMDRMRLWRLMRYGRIFNPSAFLLKVLSIIIFVTK